MSDYDRLCNLVQAESLGRLTERVSNVWPNFSQIGVFYRYR